MLSLCIDDNFFHSPGHSSSVLTFFFGYPTTHTHLQMLVKDEQDRRREENLLDDFALLCICTCGRHHHPGVCMCMRVRRAAHFHTRNPHITPTHAGYIPTSTHTHLHCRHHHPGVCVCMRVGRAVHIYTSTHAAHASTPTNTRTNSHIYTHTQDTHLTHPQHTQIHLHTHSVHTYTHTRGPHRYTNTYTRSTNIYTYTHAAHTRSPTQT